MIVKCLLKLAGKMDALVYKTPLIGEQLVRNKANFLGNIAFHMPVLGSRPCGNIIEVQQKWFGFMERFGFKAHLDDSYPNEFYWSIDSCPYHFKRSDQQSLCDACMDFDRTYIRLLGGELEILDTIPAGSDHCRFKILYAMP
jgi:hypothetical protein